MFIHSFLSQLKNQLIFVNKRMISFKICLVGFISILTFVQILIFITSWIEHWKLFISIAIFLFLFKVRIERALSQVWVGWQDWTLITSCQFGIILFNKILVCLFHFLMMNFIMRALSLIKWKSMLFILRFYNAINFLCKSTLHLSFFTPWLSNGLEIVHFLVRGHSVRPYVLYCLFS